MATEFEIKLRAQNVQQLSDILSDAQVRCCAQEKLREIHMRTAYFDTADGALSKRRWMLRVRQENEKSVVTMKTPGEGYARGEWECEGENPEHAIETLIAKGAPEELRSLAAPGLQEVCGAEFVRLTQPLRISDQTACEICADGGTLLGGRRREPFYELELELSGGSEAELLAFARTLAEKYGLCEEPKSKFVRARRLADGE